MERVTAAAYHDIAKPADPRLSPNGDRVAFLRKQPNGDDSYESTVYVVDADGTRPPRRLTLAEGADAEPRWSPSGDRIAFTSTRGADDDRQQLWVLPMDGGEARQVTDVVGGVSGIAWSPDGERIAFTQSVTPEDREADRDLSVPDEYEPEDHPDPRVIDRTVYRASQSYFDGRRPGVYVVDADAVVDGVAGESGGAGGSERASESEEASESDAPNSSAVERVTDRDADFAAPEWGDADTLYYTESVGEDPDDSYEIAIHAHDIDDDSVERIHTTTGWGTSLAATPDGQVAFAHTEPDQASMNQSDLHVFDRASDAVHSVTDGLDRGVGYEASPQWGPEDESLYFATPDEGQTALWSVPADASTEPERIFRRGAIAGATVGGPSESDGVTVAIGLSEWNHPGDVFVFDTGTDETTRLTELNAALLADRHVGEPEELRFESDGAEIQGWVLTPPGFGEGTDSTDPGDGEYPLAVEIHGGPHAMWTTSGTMWHEFQTLAARGYVVFWSNPRGSSGYGESFLQAIERDWGDVTLTDVEAGVGTVLDDYPIDEENVFVTGGSFGGFMTAWAVGQTDRFRAAVAQRGVYDLTGFYGSTDGAYKLLEGDFDTVPSAEPGWLWDRSPTGHADAVDTPTLLIHSEDDTRTPICTAELYHRILRKNRVDTRFVRYPREGHELSRSGEPAHVVDRIERIARWFDGYSDHHDAARALDRPEDDGLTAAEEDKNDDADEE